MYSEKIASSVPVPRDARLDVLRGILILGVVGVHFGGSMVFDKAHLFAPSFWIGLTVNQFFSISVPGFIFFSGYALSMHYEDKKIAWCRFVLKRLRKLLPNYIAVTLFYFIFLKQSAMVKAVTWENMAGKLLYTGVDGYLYFVSLIMQLYILFPFISQADGWVNVHILRKKRESQFGTSVFLSLFLLIHVVLGHLSYSGEINYYYYCRPFCLFWMFNFYLGFRFRRLMLLVPKENKRRLLLAVALLLTVTIFTITMWLFTDKTLTGEQFEKIPLDFVYARPLTMWFNIIVTIAIGLLLSTSINFRCKILQKFGKNSYAIYLWHIVILLYAAWTRPDVMTAARLYPGVFILILFFPCFVVTWANDFFKAKQSELANIFQG